MNSTTISTVTEFLKTLTCFSEQVDGGKANDTEYIKLQRIEPQIIEAYQAQRIHEREYRALNGIYHYVKDEYLKALNLQ